MEFKLKSFCLIAGAVAMVIFSGCSKGLKFARYFPKDPAVDLTIEYVSDWQHTEQKGAYGSFSQVVFDGPRRPNKNLSAIIVVTVQKSAKVKFKSLTTQGFQESFLSERVNYTDYKELSIQSKKLQGADAREILMSYKLPDKLDIANPKFVPMKEKAFIFKRGDNFYAIRYVNSEEDFSDFDKAFTRMIKSIKFKE